MANTDKRFTPIGGGTPGHSHFTVSSNEDTDRFRCDCGYESFFRSGPNSIAEHMAAAKTEAA